MGKIDHWKRANAKPLTSRRCPEWVTNCLADYVSVTTGVPQIAAGRSPSSSRQGSGQDRPSRPHIHSTRNLSAPKLQGIEQLQGEDREPAVNLQGDQQQIPLTHHCPAGGQFISFLCRAR